eukprot:m.228026 g.228026  ORF g.228026 m.228026 type:complete len:216 (-) comp37417_c0_seq1:202-849(-)
MVVLQVGLCASLAMSLVTLPGAHASCPALPPMRTERVVDAFNASGLAGLWYEWAYADPAQVGSSCQTLNGTVLPTGVVNMAFSVRYNTVPFTIVEVYTPSTQISREGAGHQDTNSTKGLYIKRVKAPGSQLLELPTVFVDFTPSLSGGLYDTITIYSCTVKLGITVHEVVFAGRTPQPPNNTVLESMEQTARGQGVVWDSLHIVNRTHCGRHWRE